MKINNYKFLNFNSTLIVGLIKEIEDNPLLLPFFKSNAASNLLKSIVGESDEIRGGDMDHRLLDEINSLLTFVDQNSNKESFYLRHIGESKDEFYSRTKIKSYKMYSEIFRIRKISDKAIELVKTVNELSAL